MELRKISEDGVTFLSSPGSRYLLDVKEHRGAGNREVSVYKIRASGEPIDHVVAKTTSAIEIVLAAFRIEDEEPPTYRPQAGVMVMAKLPGEGWLPLKSDTFQEVVE